MRAAESAAVVTFVIALAFAFVNLSVEIQLLPFAMLLGWLAADFFSGLVHWALDSFGSVHTPVFGPAFIRPFREHHADPAGMTRHDFIEVNGASCFGCLPLLLLAFFLDGFVHALVVFTCLGVLFTNQCHKWAHSEQPPFPVQLFQRIGFILSSKEHIKHHTPPFNSHFCTASGWLNAPFNCILKVFR